MSDKEIIRYAFLSDFVKESSEEEIINKLIELDDKLKEKNKNIKQLESVIDKALEELEKYKLVKDNDDFVSLSAMYEFLIDNSIEILGGKNE